MTTRTPNKKRTSYVDFLAKHRLPAEWFHRDVVTVAKDLIGCALVHRSRAGVIVETEAYLGPEDLASHARFGSTPRTSVMFGRGGITYVYLCYGIHQMFNIVTGPEGSGQAVLVRAIAPLAGLPDDPSVGRGPGKVTKALGLDHRHDRKDLAKGQLYVAAYMEHDSMVESGPRIGVEYAGEDWGQRPLRFWRKDDPSVSRPSKPKTHPSVSRGTRAAGSRPSRSTLRKR